MKTVYIGGEGEIVEKKSRFIATVRPVASEEEAVAFIAEMKKKYWDARHNCSAFVIGDRQELSRCSDDGEPAQTAGSPMLDVLLREEIDSMLQGLNERERQVIKLRFGLENGRPLTLEEVGRQFNVTRERIRQIETAALRKLRNPVRSKKVRDFLP